MTTQLSKDDLALIGYLQHEKKMQEKTISCSLNPTSKNDKPIMFGIRWTLWIGCTSSFTNEENRTMEYNHLYYQLRHKKNTNLSFLCYMEFEQYPS